MFIQINELDPRMLYQVTRRNSHPYADHADNYKRYGANFLTKRDCQNFDVWLGDDNVDDFVLDLEVKDFEDDADLNEHLLDFEVFFIYEDYSLKGTATNMRYWKEGYERF